MFRIKNNCAILFNLLLFSFTGALFADNPLISQRYTADPNGFVYNGRVYVICSSDEENVDSYNLINYTLLSSDDMANWTDHGLVFKVKSVTTWAGQAYAPTACVRNGKVWLYFPNGATSIGVAVADRPEGPYKDPLKKPLITKNMTNCNVDWLFDPCVFVDSTESGTQAYLTFGGGTNSTSPYGSNLRIIKLNDDMISVSGTAVTITAPSSFEASFLHKYKDKYYFSYATTGASKIDYLMSDDPMTGYTHKGTFLENPTLNGQNINLNNNSHGGPVLYKEQWYMFYHDRRISDAVYKRNASVDVLYYNEDGTIKKVVVSSEGPKQIKYLNPFDTIQAETIWKQQGIEVDFCSEGGTMVTSISDGDYTSLKGVDFASGAETLEVRAASGTSGGTIELHLGSETGTLVGKCEISGTGSWTSWQTFSCDITDCSGVKNLYIVYKGSDEPFRINWFRFIGKSTEVRVNSRHLQPKQRENNSFLIVPGGNRSTLSFESMFNLSGRALPGSTKDCKQTITAGGMYIIRK